MPPLRSDPWFSTDRILTAALSTIHRSSVFAIMTTSELMTKEEREAIIYGELDPDAWYQEMIQTGFRRVVGNTVKGNFIPTLPGAAFSAMDAWGGAPWKPRW
jgi:hypothetical protein